MVKGVMAKIHVDPQACPRFCKPRSVPFAMKEKVEEELECLLKEGIIEPMQLSEWAAPIVPVWKSDGSVRICGDYWMTINQAAKLDAYPLPKIEDLFTSLSAGVYFTKLDLSHAYQQLQLDETSRPYVTINTHKGLFQYTHLPFGVSSAPAIFQRTMESLLQGMDQVVVYIDDILIAGRTQAEHLKKLDEVMQRLKEAGTRLKKSAVSSSLALNTWDTASVRRGYNQRKKNAKPSQGHPSPTMYQSSRCSWDSSTIMANFCQIWHQHWHPSTNSSRRKHGGDGEKPRSRHSVKQRRY